MQCPFCKSNNVEVPTVDIGVGEQQCGPAFCIDCNSSQNSDGDWEKYELVPLQGIPKEQIIESDVFDDFDEDEDEFIA